MSQSGSLQAAAPAAPVAEPARLLLEALLALALLTMCELTLLRQLEAGSLHEYAREAEAILTGHAHWRAFQSRLLGPYLVSWLARLSGGTFEDAYAVATQDLVVLANVVGFVLARRLTGSSWQALIAVAVLAGFFIGMQGDGWVYLWDFSDLNVMLLFAYAIVVRARARFFVVLFAIELFNREAAQFIALWLVLRAILPRRRPDWLSLGLGGVLLVAGAMWTVFIRERLFVSSIDASIGADLSHKVGGQHFRLGENLVRLARVPGLEAAAVVGLLWALVFLLMRSLRQLDRTISSPLVVLCGVMLTSVLCFGAVDEPRVYIFLIPFVVIVGAAVQNAAARAAGPSLPPSSGGTASRS